MKRALSIIILMCPLFLISEASPLFATTHSPPSRQASSQQVNLSRDESRRQGATLSQRAYDQYELGRTSEDEQVRSVHFRRAERFAQQAIEVFRFLLVGGLMAVLKEFVRRLPSVLQESDLLLERAFGD